MSLSLVSQAGRLQAWRDGGRRGAGDRACEGARAEPAGRDVLVTRPVCLTDETATVVEGGCRPFKAGMQPEGDLPFFVDWLSIAQDHPAGGLPLVDSGVVVASDADGELEWSTIRAVRHEGSFETSVGIKCDGHRVTFSGNMSRFGRADNVFGFDFFQCLARINELLDAYGLPRFTAGERREVIKRGAVRSIWSGARVSRIDLTANYCAGSADDAHAVLQYLGEQHVGRQEGRRLGQGETVAWGKGSRRQYWKCYIKWLELQAHGNEGRIVDWCKESGLVRLEGTIKSNALTDLGCAYLGDYFSGWAMGQLVQLFTEHAAVLSRPTKSTDDLDELPRHLRATARDYLAGMDVTRSLSRATFYRHRNELLPFGVDIAMRNVTPFKPRVRVVQLAAAVAPPWYQLAA